MSESQIGKDKEIAIAQAVINSVMAGVRIMVTIAPEWRWTGLGNFLGAYGEFIAIHDYGLKKEPNGTAGHDAITADGRTVAVKANHASKQINFRGSADLMLVLEVAADGSCAQLYWGPFAPVYAESRHSSRDNKQTISVTKLKRLSQLHPQLPGPNNAVL